MNSAPIILFTYKRLDTLERCIASLQKCPESKQSNLIIVCDFAAKEADIEKVNAVRQFLPTISGFKDIEIIERDKNYGVDYNIIDGIQLMAERYDQFIVVEDDLVVAPGFLRFLNVSLNFYKKNTDVLSVSGFSFVDKIPENYLYDGYFAKRTCPWGWATWSDKIKEVDWEIKDKNAFLNSNKVQKDFNEWGSDRSRMLMNTLQGKIRAWDIRLDYHQFLCGSCTLYPVATLVQNIGFGSEDASNTFGYNRFKTKFKPNSKDAITLPDSVLFNKVISKNFISKNSLEQRIFTRVMKLINYKN
ncbi:glycosyltransferase family 2 protein [Flavobacterium sp. LS2P90]|uniref:Glycosyltransferase family 2 protein n=1 Tax=Flavobacterium xylosi TaxID=3230415 RepID=A0ABW6HZ25_9FLAO